MGAEGRSMVRRGGEDWNAREDRREGGGAWDVSVAAGALGTASAESFDASMSASASSTSQYDERCTIWALQLLRAILRNPAVDKKLLLQEGGDVDGNYDDHDHDQAGVEGTGDDGTGSDRGEGKDRVARPGGAVLTTG